MPHDKGRREEFDALLELAWEGNRKRNKWAERHPTLPPIRAIDNTSNGGERDGANLSTKDWILFALATAAAVAVFMIPRTPSSVIAGTFIVFGLLINPALYVPYVLGKSKTGRTWRRVVALAVTALVVAFGGYFAWKEAVEEVVEDVSKNIDGSVSLYPDNAFASMFSFTNESGHDIVSKNISCVVYEAYLEQQNWMRRVTFLDDSSFLIKAGKDTRSTECLKPLLKQLPVFGTSNILCADVAVSMDYQLTEFPYPAENKQRRFLIRRTSAGYVWSLEAVSAKTGFCSGTDLAKY
jgi:hypothetical protein